MATRSVRRNAALLKWLRAAAFVGLVAWALAAMSFSPLAAGFGIALITGVVALFAPGVAVLIAIIAISLPLLAADFIVGAAFLVIGFASSQFLGESNGWPFLALTAAFAGALYGPVWAVALIAGWVLGTSEGAVVGILACLAIEAAGLLLGRTSFGLVQAGGIQPAVIDFANAPSNLVGFSWLSASLDSIDPNALLRVITASGAKAQLAVQPLLWGIGAAVAGLVARVPNARRRAPLMLAAAAAGTLALAGGSYTVLRLPGSATPTVGALAVAAISSLAVAFAYIAVWEYVFPRVTTKVDAVRPGSMSTEDADVDELLRLIATAEDELASKHTTNTTVMITDMKSFSKMTEEDGSYVSAKTIQRHRDLLLPIIEKHGGHGKSTGGDGLVAAFPSANAAVTAAAEMQTTLSQRNELRADERAIIIRIGVAAGEVVLDRGGRPFIGNGLNMAARVMNLADGGQAFVTRRIADEAGDVPGVRTASHGEFSLKNIADPVEVIEILWAEDQEPMRPGERTE